MKQLKLVEDLDVSDEFILIPSKSPMKKAIKLLADNPGSAMLVQDKKSGKIIESSAISYADAMEEMMDGKACKDMAKAGPKQAEKYKLEHVVSMWGRLYDEVVT